ncbi:centromere protein M isoform X2 [Hirundo rustica]|uniref:centromere protein M isoform X2 n=1 Tax=Hirundo rustica TaxID=43150 RepID=UPI001A953611|nr:centromere protein M isoform X2 [Hirundo rustica]
MAVLRPLDKLPTLNSVVLLLVGSDEALQQKLAEAILQEKKDFNINMFRPRGRSRSCRARRSERDFALANAREHHYPDVTASAAGKPLCPLGRQFEHAWKRGGGGGSISHVHVHHAHTLAFCMLYICLITKLERCENNTFFPPCLRDRN